MSGPSVTKANEMKGENEVKKEVKPGVKSGVTDNMVEQFESIPEMLPIALKTVINEDGKQVKDPDDGTMMTARAIRIDEDGVKVLQAPFTGGEAVLWTDGDGDVLPDALTPKTYRAKNRKGEEIDKQPKSYRLPINSLTLSGGTVVRLTYSKSKPSVVTKEERRSALRQEMEALAAKLEAIENE